MNNRADRAKPRATIATILLLAATVLSAAAEIETTRCTVRKVDPATREITAVTGCGYALRVRTFQVDSDCTFALVGSRADLAGLTAGQVVEVQHRKRGGRDVALRVASVSPAEDRGRP